MFGATMKILKPSEVQVFPDLEELSPEELAEAHALAKAAFTAQGLQRFTEEDEGIPMDVLMQELEEVQRTLDQGRA